MKPTPLRIIRRFLAAVLILTATAVTQAADEWVVYEPGSGPGDGKHIVLISGDEEYRSEEALPQLGKILAKHHGFKCTVLFSIDPETGAIDPDTRNNTPGLESLESADLMILSLRFRELPDDQMRYVVDYVESGRPIIGMRTATHAFNNSKGAYTHYHWGSKEWPGGFGRQVLGETWINHHGHHGKQSTRGIITGDHPITSGIKDGDVWGPTDVYGVRLPLPEGCQPIVLGQVLVGMKPGDDPLEGEKNEPMMPVAWIKSYKGAQGKTARVFTTTMGASQDLSSAGTRRLLVNAAYWAAGIEDQIDPDSSVDVVGDYQPTPFGFGKSTKGVMPASHKLN